MIVAVTGASGHLGANLVRALLKDNQTVRALINTNRKSLNGLKVETVQADIQDTFSLSRAFAGVDVVYHLAALISLSMNNWKSVEAVNVIGTHNVVEACLKCGVRRLVHFSSIHAIEQTPMNVPVDELRPLIDAEDCPPYDRSKAAGEREVRQGIEQGLDAVILNPTAVIGPNDYQLSHFGQVLLLLAQGKLPALIEGGFNWVDARDVASAAIKAETKAPLGAKYLLSGHWASVVDLANLVAEITGVPAPRLVVPAWLARTGAPVVTTYNRITRNRPLYTSVSIRALNNCNLNISHERATRELNFNPRPLRQTIFDSLIWFQNNGMLDKSLKLNAGPDKL
jgi:dihydroflavonol-4-reductase